MLHVASMDAHRSTHDLVTDVSLCGDAVILQVFSLLATAITMNLRAKIPVTAAGSARTPGRRKNDPSPGPGP